MKKQQNSHKNNKNIPGHRQSHFGTYGTRQPVTGSDHKKNIHDKVDNFVREDGFRRRTVKGIEQHIVPQKVVVKNKKRSAHFVLKKPKIILISILFLILLLIVLINL